MNRLTAPCQVLLNRVQQITHLPTQGVVRVSTPVCMEDSLSWLSGVSHSNSYYWQSRDGDYQVAGLLEADCIEGDHFAACQAAVRERLDASEDDTLRYLGGRGFDTDACRQYLLPATRFVLPRVSIERRGDKTTLNAYLVGQHRKTLQQQKQQAATALRLASQSRSQEPTSCPRVTAYHDQPSYLQWQSAVDQLLQMIDKEMISKCVLARRRRIQLTHAISAPQLLKAWRDMSENSFYFCFPLGMQQQLLGASPELLFSQKKQWITTEALASTLPRGEHTSATRQFQQHLLNHPKLRHEHAVVAHFIAQQLKQLCSEVQPADEITVRPLRHLQHLYQGWYGQLKPNTSLDEIMATLHPTPATCGTPTDTAKQYLQQLEGFHRHWYAGAIGWIGRDDAEFAVAIRSGLLQQQQLDLFAGTGIVAGSDADAEWQELALKLAAPLACLTHSEQRTVA